MTTWADALVDAEAMLSEALGAVLKAKQRVRRLKAAVKICQERVASGEAFPFDPASRDSQKDAR